MARRLDSIDHAPGGRDDVANAVAGALVGATGPSEPAFLTYMRGEVERMQAERATATNASRPYEQLEWDARMRARWHF